MEATNKQGANKMTYTLPTPRIIKMDEGEAQIRTFSERLWEAKNVLHPHAYAYLDNKVELLAEKWWNSYTDDERELALFEIGCHLENWEEIPTASPIGHTVGYDQY